MDLDHFYIARQPIYDNKLNVVAYELLFRDGNVDSANIEDDTGASAQAIANIFIHIGLDQLCGSALAFLNIPRQLIEESEMLPDVTSQAVLELQRDAGTDTEYITGLEKLRNKGFKLALSNCHMANECESLLPWADFLKCDVSQMEEDDLKDFVQRYRGDDRVLLAEKVETREKMELCQSLGFNGFQGYFFSRPEIVEHRGNLANRMVALQLLKELQAEDVEIAKLETILARDVTLSFKLLRYINSSAFALRREIDSIKDAIVLLGIRNIKNWITMLLMTQVMEGKPPELIVTGMIRARMGELLAGEFGLNCKEQMFIIGLFSVLDALMDRKMVDLLDEVSLSTTVKLALLEHSGEAGELLEQIIQYMQGEWDALEASGADVDLYRRMYLKAMVWADMNLRELRK